MKPVVIGDATLYCGDCLEILPMLQTVDAVIADPPYGETSLEWDEHVNGWDSLLHTDCLWCFVSMRFFIQHKFSGWTFGQEIIWEKHNGSAFHADRFRRVHEIAVQFYKGRWSDLYKSPPTIAGTISPRVFRRDPPPHLNGSAVDYLALGGDEKLERSVIRVASTHGYADHPTQKPIGIISPLVQYSSPSAGIVLDPFMGSGTTGVACAQLGRKFVGIEISDVYFNIACRRIEDAYRQKKLFPEEQENSRMPRVQDELFSERETG